MNTEKTSLEPQKQPSCLGAVRRSAMEWWNGLASLRKTQLCDTNTELVGSVRRWETLTGREVQMIYEAQHFA